MLKTTHNIVGEEKKEHSIFLGKAKANTLQKGMQLESPCHLTHLNRERGPDLKGAPAVEEPASAA